jgi:hypothetical protein
MVRFSFSNPVRETRTRQKTLRFCGAFTHCYYMTPFQQWATPIAMICRPFRAREEFCKIERYRDFVKPFLYTVNLTTHYSPLITHLIIQRRVAPIANKIQPSRAGEEFCKIERYRDFVKPFLYTVNLTTHYSPLITHFIIQRRVSPIANKI